MNLCEAECIDEGMPLDQGVLPSEVGFELRLETQCKSTGQGTLNAEEADHHQCVCCHTISLQICLIHLLSVMSGFSKGS